MRRLCSRAFVNPVGPQPIGRRAAGIRRALRRRDEGRPDRRALVGLGSQPYFLTVGGRDVQTNRVIEISREERQAEILSRQAALYRLAFGQPRQTDLIALLVKTDFLPEEREKLFIQLTPPNGGRDEATN